MLQPLKECGHVRDYDDDISVWVLESELQIAIWVLDESP